MKGEKVVFLKEGEAFMRLRAENFQAKTFLLFGEEKE